MTTEKRPSRIASAYPARMARSRRGAFGVSSTSIATILSFTLATRSGRCVPYPPDQITGTLHPSSPNSSRSPSQLRPRSVKYAATHDIARLCASPNPFVAPARISPGSASTARRPRRVIATTLPPRS